MGVGRRSTWFAALVAASTLAGAAIVASTPVEAASTTYYLSCRGNDGATGRSPSKAWRSFTRAEQAELRPGDKLLLERNCTWTGDRLDIAWSGTSTKRILIGNYGSGSKPLLRDGKNSVVKITGSHLIVRGLRVHWRPFNQIACGQSIGEVYGFNLTGGASNVTITKSEASGATAGVHLSTRSSNNKILDNDIFENNVLTSFGSNPARDLGAWGVLVRSDGNEIAYNRLRDNTASCRNQGYKLHSNSIELYEATNTSIHHNRSEGDRVFSELGSSAAKKASNNLFERNIFVTDQPDSRFITTRGADDGFGPVRSTRVLHNTTYQTGARSQGVVCGGGCGNGVLEVRNNIFVAEEKALFANGNVTLGPNLAWSVGPGDPLVQIIRASNQTVADAERLTITADPRFQNANRGNFRLKRGSPAVNAADSTRVSRTDFANRGLQSGRADLGAYDSWY
ncbi:MAG: hypothetical protein AAFP84_04395 [Actinomycetota bacterium]